MLLTMYVFAQVVVSGILFIVKIRDTDKDHIPTIFTMIGVLGTFIGVTAGLINFNVENIDVGITDLLESLKLAFISSIVGLLFAITFRLVSSFQKSSEDSASTIEEFAEIIQRNLESINQTSKEAANSQKATAQKMDAVVNSICGDGETTLYTQFQKLRVAVGDSGDKITNEVQNIGSSINSLESRLTTDLHQFRTSSENASQRLYDAYVEYAEKMAEYNAKALAEQFEQLIKDFNSKIHEQFGENFARLNDAVGRMLEWQDSYQRQLEDMRAHFEQATTVISVAANTLTLVSEQAEKYTRSAENLEKLLGDLSVHTQLIEEQIIALDDAGQRAKEAMPLISESVSKLTDEFSKSTTDAVAIMKDGWEENRSSAIELWDVQRDMVTRQNEQIVSAVDGASSKLNESLTGSLSSIDATVSNVSSTLKDTSEKSQESIGSALKSLQSAYNDTASAVKQQTAEQLSSLSNAHTQAQQQIEKFIRDATARYEGELLNQMQDLQNRLVDQTQEFDKVLGEELTKSLESLGGNLSSLSEKFVSDYSPLTERLKEVVQIAQDLDKKE
jgi:chromosome segregation ATPase